MPLKGIEPFCKSKTIIPAKTKNVPSIEEPIPETIRAKNIPDESTAKPATDEIIIELAESSIIC